MPEVGSEIDLKGVEEIDVRGREKDEGQQCEDAKLTQPNPSNTRRVAAVTSGSDIWRHAQEDLRKIRERGKSHVKSL
ncbi:hypothetical protein Plhal304r1_c019g0066181 [Plasmopara halstedii]